MHFGEVVASTVLDNSNEDAFDLRKFEICDVGVHPFIQNNVKWMLSS